jgi:hypothetical protein
MLNQFFNGQTMVLNAVKEIATLASGAKNISSQLESALSSALQERNGLWERVDGFCQSLKDSQKTLKQDQDDDDMYAGLSPELAQALRLLIEAELKPVQKVTEPKVENVVVTQLDEVLKDSQSKLTNQNDDAQTANLRAQLLQRARDAQINAVTADIADPGSDAVGDAIVLPVMDLSSTVHRVQDQLEAQLDSQLNMSNEDLLLGLLQQAFAQDVETGQRLAALLRDRQFIALVLLFAKLHIISCLNFLTFLMCMFESVCIGEMRCLACYFAITTRCCIGSSQHHITASRNGRFTTKCNAYR